MRSLFIFIALFFALALPVSAFATKVDDDKVYICHATGSENNPYTYNNVSVSSVKDRKDWFSGHGNHAGDMWTSFYANNGDYVEGQGDQNFIEAGCKPPTTPTSVPSTATPVTPTSTNTPTSTLVPTDIPTETPTVTPTEVVPTEVVPTRTPVSCADEKQPYGLAELWSASGEYVTMYIYPDANGNLPIGVGVGRQQCVLGWVAVRSGMFDFVYKNSCTGKYTFNGNNVTPRADVLENNVCARNGECR